jgi:hypothetical protein
LFKILGLLFQLSQHPLVIPSCLHLLVFLLCALLRGLLDVLGPLLRLLLGLESPPFVHEWYAVVFEIYFCFDRLLVVD